MDDIAKNSGYSKATLYVYFKSKEILTSYLVLQSMQTLYDFIYKALHENNTCKERFFGICNSLYEYKKLYPLYFSLVHKPLDLMKIVTTFAWRKGIFWNRWKD